MSFGKMHTRYSREEGKMASRNEAEFSLILQKLLRETCVVQPIESETVGVGIPDLWLYTRRTKVPKVYRHLTAWLELKDMSDSKDPLVAKISYEPGQLNKLNEYWQAGCITITIIRHRDVVFLVPTPAVDRNTQIIKKDHLAMVQALKLPSLSAKEADQQKVFAEAFLYSLKKQETD